MSAEESKTNIPVRLSSSWKVRTVSLLFVFIPWILIAIPAQLHRTSLGNAKFGWPFVHFREHLQTSSTEQVRLTLAALNEFPELNLRHGKTHPVFTQQGFWANPQNWPSSRKGTVLKIQMFGLLLNVGFIFTLTYFVETILQRRMKRKRKLLQFSLSDFLLFSAIVSLALYWCTSEYLSQQKVNKVTATELEILHTESVYETRFPLVISELLNHGKNPFDSSQDLDPIFVRKSILPANIWIYSFGETEVSQEIVAHYDQKLKIVDKHQLPVAVRLGEDSDTTLAILREIMKREVESVHVSYDSSEFADHFSNKMNSSFRFGDIFDSVSKATLRLRENSDQQFQILPFTGTNNLKSIFLAKLSTTGVQFLLRTKKQWQHVKLKVTFAPTVPQELKTQLLDEFQLKADVNQIYRR